MSSRTVEVQTNVVRDDDAVRVRRRRGGAGSSALYGLVDAARVRGGVVPSLLTGFTSACKGEAASSCAQLGRRRRRWVLPVWHYRADVGGRGAFRHAYLRDQSLRDEAARPANDSRVCGVCSGCRPRRQEPRDAHCSIISNGGAEDFRLESPLVSSASCAPRAPLGAAPSLLVVGRPSGAAAAAATDAIASRRPERCGAHSSASMAARRRRPRLRRKRRQRNDGRTHRRSRHRSRWRCRCRLR